MKKSLILILVCPFFLIAQDNNNDAKHQQIIMSVLEKVNEYESNSGLRNENKFTQFIELFEGPNTMVVNDIPAIGDYDKSITIEQYISLMRKYYSGIVIKVQVNEISPITYEGPNKGYLSVYLTKSASGKNSKHKFEVEETYEDSLQKFDEYVEYNDSFELELKFIFNNNSYKIKEIKLTEPKGRLLVIFPFETTILNNVGTPINDMQIKIEGKKVKLEGYFHSIPDIFKNTEIEIVSSNTNYSGSEKINLKKAVNSSTNNVYKLKFKKSIGFAQGFSLLTASKVKINTNSYGATLSDISPLSFGGLIALDVSDLIYKNPEQKKKKKFSVFVKGGLISESLDFSINLPNYIETFSAIDVDGAKYDRTVELTNFSEQHLADLQTIFGQLEIQFKQPLSLSKGISATIFVAAGIGSVNVNSATFINSSTVNYSGYYPNLFGLTISENDVYDFGDFYLSQSGDLDFNQEVNKLLFDAGLVIDVNKFKVSGSLLYTQYQSNVFVKGGERLSNFSPELNSINNLIDVDMNHLALKIGVSYKF